MPGFSTIIRYLIAALASIGGLDIFDRIFGKKVPGYQPVSPGWQPAQKLAFAVGGIAAGSLLWNFVNRKFHIITPRHSPRKRRSRRRSRRRR